MGEFRFMQGNAAMTEGAIAAGARFYAGYPITPSSEVAETTSIRLPQVGGLYVQMEDEIGSIAAVIGASCAGKKAYTATSGPGFSLMQESLGVAVMSEIPCVIIDVQRSGPSTGMATKPAQADVMQVRWGTHGDHAIIAVSPSSVQDCFDLMITAFNLSEQYRTPVVFMADEIIAHLYEQVILHGLDEISVVERKKPSGLAGNYKPYAHTDQLPPLAAYGGEYVFKVNSSMHDEYGRPCTTKENADEYIRHLSSKITAHAKEISITRKYFMDDAECVVIAYGGVARSAISAVRKARSRGIKAGVLQVVTVWPVPEEDILKAIENAKMIIVPELNLGQYIDEIRKRSTRPIPIIGVNRVDGYPIQPDAILERIEEVEKL